MFCTNLAFMVELGCDLPPLRNRVIQEGDEMRWVDWVAYLLLDSFSISSAALYGKKGYGVVWARYSAMAMGRR